MEHVAQRSVCSPRTKRRLGKWRSPICRAVSIALQLPVSQLVKTEPQLGFLRHAQIPNPDVRKHFKLNV